MLRDHVYHFLVSATRCNKTGSARMRLPWALPAASLLLGACSTPKHHVESNIGLAQTCEQIEVQRGGNVLSNPDGFLNLLRIRLTARPDPNGYPADTEIGNSAKTRLRTVVTTRLFGSATRARTWDLRICSFS